MDGPVSLQPKFKPQFAFLLLALVLTLGLLFRVANLDQLDQKVFWVDEVATVIRAVGYTKAEVVSQLADGALHTPADLLAYQRITANRTLSDTLHALAHSPEHAPLYFLLTRFWMQGFGSSVGAIRSFSVFCSLLVLPCVYWFCQQVFSCNRVSWTAVVLIAVSPFFVAYAQEARPYSFWLLTVVLCSGALLRSIRLNSWGSWAIYAMTLTLSCYTSLLSVLLAVGQGIYVSRTKRQFNSVQFHSRLFHSRLFHSKLFHSGLFHSGLFHSRLWRYGVAISAATLAFSPWIWVILHHQDALEANTTWMRTSISPLAMVAIWLYSFAVLFFDVPIVTQGWIALLQAIVAATVLAIIVCSLYRLWQRSRWIWLFLMTLCLPVPLTLILLDLVFRGQASATSRYLIPAQFGVLIAVAWYCAVPPLSSRDARSALQGRSSIGRERLRLMDARRLWQSTVAFLLSLSLISCWVNLNRSPDYQKARNRHNPEIAALLNQATHPILLAEPTQTIDLLSLSHNLNSTVQLRILPLDRLLRNLETCRSIFLFNPSPTLVTTAQTIGLNPLQIYQPELLTSSDIFLSLWSIPSASNCRTSRSS